MFPNLRRVVFALLCVVSFLVPWEELFRVPGLATLIFLVSAAALAISLAAITSFPYIKRIPSMLGLMAAFIFWCFCSLIWSADSQATIGKVTTYLSLLVMIWMMWEFVESINDIFKLLDSYLLGCLVTIAALFVNYLHSNSILSIEYTRFTAGRINPNELALLLDIGIVIAVYLALTKESKLTTAYWAFVFPAVLGTLLTGSRAGAMGLVVALGMGFAISWSRSWKYVLLFVLTIGCAAWLVSTVVPHALLQRVTEGTQARTLIVREVQWAAGLDAWRDVPITGVGAGAFIAAVTARGGRALVAHNTFIQILVDNGIVGMVLMLAVWVILAREVWRLPRRERLFSLGTALVWLVVATTGSLETLKITWLVYAWILMQRIAIPRTATLASRPGGPRTSRPLATTRGFVPMPDASPTTSISTETGLT
jgi:O-antigen ligase